MSQDLHSRILWRSFLLSSAGVCANFDNGVDDTVLIRARGVELNDDPSATPIDEVDKFRSPFLEALKLNVLTRNITDDYG
jgi:hypothetical protein